MGLLFILIGACFGALLMYFYDPHAGHIRRARLAGQLGRSSQAIGHASASGVREIRDRLTVRRGLVESKSPVELHDTWPPMTRMLTALAGILLLVMWLGWQGFVTALLGVIGIGLLVRALTNTELKRVFGIGPHRPK